MPDRHRVMPGLHVTVMVSLTSQRQEVLEAFEQRVRELDDVVECYLVAGKADYLVTVAVKDLEAYQRFFTKRLGELPGVASLMSIIAMKTVKPAPGHPA